MAATTSGGHLHVGQGQATELGAPKLTALPSDPRERVLAVFPLLPGAYLTDRCVRRISRLIDDRHNDNREARAAAEDALKEIDELHCTLERALSEEGFLFEGVSVRGRDILVALCEGTEPSLISPHQRTSALGLGQGGHARGSGSASASCGQTQQQQKK